MPIQEKYLLKDSSLFTMAPGKDAAVSLALSKADLIKSHPVYITFWVAVKKGRKIYKQRVRITWIGNAGEPQFSQISSRQRQFIKESKGRRHRRGCSVPVDVKLFVTVRRGAQQQRQRYSIKNL